MFRMLQKMLKKCVVAKFKQRFQRNWQLEFFNQRLNCELQNLTRVIGFGIFRFYPCIETWQSKVSRERYQCSLVSLFILLNSFNCRLNFIHQSHDRKIFCGRAVRKWKTSHAKVCVGFSSLNHCWESSNWITSEFTWTFLQHYCLDILQTARGLKFHIYGGCSEWKLFISITE